MSPKIMSVTATESMILIITMKKFFLILFLANTQVLHSSKVEEC